MGPYVKAIPSQKRDGEPDADYFARQAEEWRDRWQQWHAAMLEEQRLYGNYSWGRPIRSVSRAGARAIYALMRLEAAERGRPDGR